MGIMVHSSADTMIERKRELKRGINTQRTFTPHCTWPIAAFIGRAWQSARVWKLQVLTDADASALTSEKGVSNRQVFQIK